MRLTKRDTQIFRFLLDQKFASLDALYLRFFDHRNNPSAPFPTRLYVTRQRLRLLVKAEFLKTERVYTDAESLYLLAPKGYRLLKTYAADPPYAIPIKDIDFRNYVHDRRVTYCRIALERTRRAFHWVSERQIRMKGFAVEGERMPDTVIPDGIFLSAKGQRVAFEIELSDRRLSRFEAKATEYENVMAAGFLDHVLWISGGVSIYRALASCVGRNPRFTLGRYEEFHDQLFPRRMDAGAK